MKILVEFADDGRLRQLKRCPCGHWYRAAKSDRKRYIVCSRNDYCKTETGKQANRQQAVQHYQMQRPARLVEVRRVLSQWPSRPSAATKAEWQGLVIAKAKGKLTRSFLTRAVKNGEVTLPT